MATIQYATGAGFSFGEAFYRTVPESFDGTVFGVVTGYERQASRTMLYIKLLSMKDNASDTFTSCRFGAGLSVDTEMPYPVGTYLLASGTVRKPSTPTNPGEFNQYIYQRARGRDFLLYEPCILSERETQTALQMQYEASHAVTGFFLMRFLRMKRSMLLFRERLSAILETGCDSVTAGLLKAILLGDRSGLPDSVKSDFQKAGTSHLLAISGLHLSVVAGCLYAALRRLGVSYFVSGLLGISFSFSYGIMTGASDATIRAVLMLSVALIGNMLGRSYDLLTGMAVGLLVLVTVNPFKLWDAGFLFSFCAVIGIGAVYPAFVSQGGQKKKKTVWGGVINKLWTSLAFCCSITLVTAPVSCCFYGTVSLVALILNVFALPLMTPILVLGMLALLTGLVVPCISTLLLQPVGRLLSLLCALTKTASALPHATVILGALPFGQLLLYIALLSLLCLVGARFKNRGRTAGLFVITAALLAVGIYRNPTDRFTLLDVGQGDGMLLETRTGLHILVDGGSSSRSDVGQYVLEPALKHMGVSYLDFVIVTHVDIDHTSGVRYLLAEDTGIKIGCLLYPAACRDIDSYRALSALAGQHGIRTAYLAAGEEMRQGSFSLRCVYPPKVCETEDLNNTSAVLLADYGGTTFLLTGDIGLEAEDALLGELNTVSAVDYLKVPHHGSKYACSELLLQAIKPKCALISCGKNNRYGHPHSETLNRLAQFGCKVYRTDESGAVTVEMRDKETVVELYGR